MHEQDERKPGDRAPPMPAAADRGGRLLEVALEAAGLAVWEADLRSQALHASPALFAILGCEAPASPWTLRTFERRIFPDDVPSFRDALARAVASGELRCELRIRRRDGRLAWVAMLGRTCALEQGRPARLGGVLHDITDRKASEQFVREREEQFSAVFDASSVGMAHAEPASGKLTRVNARLSALLGEPPARLLGRNFVQFLHPEDRDAVWQGHQALVRAERPTFEAEVRLVPRRGATVSALLAINVVHDGSGRPTRTALVIVDITQRRRAEDALLEREEQLCRARDELERRVAERTTELAGLNNALQLEIVERRSAEQRVRELLGGQVQAVEDERSRISRELHDTLGQDLAALTLSLKAIAAHEGTNDDARSRLHRALDMLGRLDRQLDRLAHELRPPALDDLGLAEALQAQAAAWSQEAGPTIDLHVHGLRGNRLPAIVETTVYRIVQEALTNVHKHARARRVSVILERRADQLRLVIEDDGVGMDARAARRKPGRLGLRGMAERARLVGGELEIETSPGNGTTISLVVPLLSGRGTAQ